MNDIILAFVNYSLILVATAGVVVLFAASVYDFMQARRVGRMPKTGQRLAKSQQSHISVLIYVKDSAKGLRRCLLSLAKCRHERFDVVVAVDAAASLATKRRVKIICEAVPNVSARIFIKRKLADANNIIYTAYERTQKGGIIAVISPAYQVSPDFLSVLGAEFGRDNSLDLLHGIVGFEQPRNISSLATAFVRLSYHAVLKLRSFVPWGLPTPHGVGCAYRATSLRKLRAQKQRWSWRVIPFGGAVDNDINSENSLKKASRWSILALKQVGVFALLFVSLWLAHAAANYYGVQTFLIAWGLTVAWLMAVTWLSTVIGTQTKLILTLCLSFGYFLLIGYFVASWLTRTSSYRLNALFVKQT